MAPLKVKVTKDEEIYIAQFLPLGNADQSMVENLPADELLQHRGDQLLHYEAYMVVVEHSPNDAEQPRAQGSAKQEAPL